MIKSHQHPAGFLQEEEKTATVNHTDEEGEKKNPRGEWQVKKLEVWVKWKIAHESLGFSWF